MQGHNSRCARNWTGSRLAVNCVRACHNHNHNHNHAHGHEQTTGRKTPPIATPISPYLVTSKTERRRERDRTMSDATRRIKRAHQARSVRHGHDHTHNTHENRKLETPTCEKQIRRAATRERRTIHPLPPPTGRAMIGKSKSKSQWQSGESQ